jgi:dTDP-4-dehydrorhamnose 3,5-epimerase
VPNSFIVQDLSGVLLIQPQIFRDERGFFLESYNENECKKNGIVYDFVQDNHSVSHKNVLRGLHYQISPKAQGKLVRVMQGRAFDVVVDIRQNSPSFGKHLSFILDDCHQHMLWIPPGFAHGFLALEENTHLVYKVTEFYSVECERSIRWDDPEINVQWPISEPPIISQKDASAPYLKQAEYFYA